MRLVCMFQSNPDFDQLRVFIFAQAILADPLKPIGQSADPLSCNAKTLLSQLFDYVKREHSLGLPSVPATMFILGENLDKHNLIPSREKLQTTNELLAYENNQDFHQALSAIYSSLLTR